MFIACPITYHAYNTYQGILGLGYTVLAVPPTQSWMDLLAASGGAPDVFTIQLCATGGRFWLGGYDSSFFNGSLSYTPIVQKVWYIVRMNDLQFNGHSVGVTSFGSVIVDSGTTALVLPPSVYTALIAMSMRTPLLIFSHVPNALC